MTGERKKWIDIAKIFGLVIVLMNHADLVIGRINYLGGMFYVPIFFVLAGYTWKYRPEMSLKEVTKKKARRLLVPYFFYNGCLFFFFFIKDALQSGSITAESFQPLFGILYSRSFYSADILESREALMTVRNAPTWFLTGLFTASLGFEVLVRWAKGNQKKLLYGMAACFLIAWGLDACLPVLLPWSLDTMFFHMVLMGVGYLLRERKALERLEENRLRVVLCVLLFFAVSYVSGSGNLSIRIYGNFPPFYLTAAVFGSVLAMLAARWTERHLGKIGSGLAYAGGHTIGILCLHLFVFMLLEAGGAALGIPIEGRITKTGMIFGTFVLLTWYEALLDRIKKCL